MGMTLLRSMSVVNARMHGLGLEHEEKYARGATKLPIVLIRHSHRMMNHLLLEFMSVVNAHESEWTMILPIMKK